MAAEAHRYAADKLKLFPEQNTTGKQLTKDPLKWKHPATKYTNSETPIQETMKDYKMTHSRDKELTYVHKTEFHYNFYGTGLSLNMYYNAHC